MVAVGVGVAARSHPTGARAAAAPMTIDRWGQDRL